MECFRHLIGLINKEETYYQKRRIICDFVGVNEVTPQRWITEKSVPVGEPLIKLQYYLEHHKYQVSELERLDKDVREVGRIYAFGIVTLGELADWAGYTSPTKDRQVLCLLRGSVNLTEERRVHLRDLIELYRDEIVQKGKNLMHIVTPQRAQGNVHAIEEGLKDVEQLAVTTIKEIPVVKPVKTSKVHTDAMMQSFAHLVLSMLPLAKVLASDECSAEDRKKLRELAGQDGIFRLSNLLNQLCGETARREVGGKQ